ncbi:MAG TPA: FAD-dependent monooxygenase [Dermatophilaceae bacterium]|nr:FAD-dependent monooxygenase [Dermatophilaceae bacterium]
MSTQASAVDAVVVGGGIGGLSSALALSRNGLSVRVLEQANTFGEVGAGLQLAPNATRVLDRWELLDEVRSLGFLPQQFVVKDALDGTEQVRLDLSVLSDRYGAPYLVVHRTDLHSVLMRACRDHGVDLRAGEQCVGYEEATGSARAFFASGRVEEAEVVVASDGLRSRARGMISQDAPINSGYVAYRGVVPIERVGDLNVDPHDLVLHVGPQCSLMQYPMRHGEVLNQMAIFASPTAFDDEEEWGTPNELTAAFVECTEPIRKALIHMWRDVWWPMFDRQPLDNWVRGRIVLTGDAAHPPLLYLAQGAVMAIEDAWVLGELVAEEGVSGSIANGTPTGVNWEAVLAAYNAVRPQRCRQVMDVSRDWGRLWHVGADRRGWRNAALLDWDHGDTRYTDWLFGPTALRPQDQPPLFATP